MKNVKKCSMCSKSRIRVLMDGKYVDEYLNSWKKDNVCPGCSPKRSVQASCKGCKKDFSVKFDGMEFCHSCYKSTSQKKK